MPTVTAGYIIDGRNCADHCEERNWLMSKPVVDADSCTACGICVDECPNSCLDLEDVAKLARPDDCSECGTCVDVCPNGAVSQP